MVHTEYCDYPVKVRGKLGGIRFQCRIRSGLVEGDKNKLRCPGGIEKQQCAIKWSRSLGSPTGSPPGPHRPEEGGHIGTDLAREFEKTWFND